MFETEEIPDLHCLYRRIKNKYISGDDIDEGAFFDKERKVSVNWCKYSSPKITVDQSPDPPSYGAARLSIPEIRARSEYAVRHEPMITNRAHSIVACPGRPAKYMDALKQAAILVQVPH